MKKGVFLLLFITVSLLSKKITFVTDEWYPFVSKEKKGIVLEIIDQIMNDLETEYEVEFMPWKKCEITVLLNDMTFSLPYIKTDYRLEKYFYHNEPLFRSKDYFFYYGKNPGVQKFYSLEVMKNYKIGGVVGFHYVEPFKKMRLNAEFDSNELQGIKKLRSGKIDYFIGTEFVTKMLIKEHFPNDTNFHILEPEYACSENFIFCSNDDTAAISFLKKFDKKLIELKNTEKYKKLLDKYGL